MGKHHRADKDSPFEKTIHLIEVASRATRALTQSGSGANHQPRWAPDSRRLAFISNRADRHEAQLYLIDINGGEARALTDLRGVVGDPKWSADGRSIAFLYNGTLEPNKRPDPDPIVVDAAPRFNRVWILDVETRALRAITSSDCHVFEYDWSPDGKTLAALTSPHPNPAESWYSAQLHTVDAATGEIRQVCQMPHQVGRLTWSPDSASIAFVSGVMSDQGNVAGEVYLIPAVGDEPVNLTPTTDHSITWIQWRDEGILYGSRQVDSTVLGWIDPKSGAQRPISRGAYSINGWGAQQVSAGQGKTFAALRESYTEPPNVFIGSLADGAWSPLTELSPDLPPLRVENRYWRGGDGDSIHGFLVYPPGYTPGRRYPLFAHVHGGPSWGYVPRFVSLWERLLIARGCLVFLPNPRGSWGYGHGFQSANVGDLGGGDWRDINAGVDDLIETGLADPERLAIGGWSYGGYLTAWAVTQTDRFRCAIAGASITNYESNYGVVPNREWQTTMFGSNVYDDFDLHRSRSPIAFASRVKTPTLLVHGECDAEAPVTQAVEFYIALKHFGVPTQLVIYPRERHGFEEHAHQIDLYQRIVGWVDKYLLGDG
jgi:dipeptidyl aminopeptidase/acylaminoacyl peptidase